MESWVQSWRPCANAFFAFFPVHLSKLLRLPRKSDARSYKVLHLSRKIISVNLKIWCSKMQPFSGNQRPDLLTALMNMSLVLRLPRKMHLCRSSSNVPRLPSFLEMLQNPHVFTFDKVHNPLRLPRETTSERPKVARTCGVLNILTSKWSLRHNGVHFSTSQFPKVVREWCVLYILNSAFEMCFAPQRRALFRHLNFQKWSGPGVFCTCWLGNVLRATMACTFSSLIWPAGSAPAALASLLFDPSEPQIIGKTQCFGTFLPFRAPASSFFWFFLFSDLLSSALLSSTLLFSLTLPISAFHLSILSEVWLLNFLRIYWEYSSQLTFRFFNMVKTTIQIGFPMKKKRWLVNHSIILGVYHRITIFEMRSTFFKSQLVDWKHPIQAESLPVNLAPWVSKCLYMLYNIYIYI